MCGQRLQVIGVFFFISLQMPFWPPVGDRETALSMRHVTLLLAQSYKLPAASHRWQMAHWPNNAPLY